jgi:membrane protease YdiL (CAAX protease family)
LDQYHFQQSESEQPDFEQYDRQAKSIISRSFIAVFVLAAVTLTVSTVIQLLVNRYLPVINEANWYLWALTAVSLIGIGYPIYYLLMKKIPDTPGHAINKLKLSTFIMFFFICASAMYITNFITQFITIFISIIKGGELANPAVDALTNSNGIISFIYAVILAPLIEEMIFRKLLLNKLRRFGDAPAILMSGIAFGLFHFNLQQGFYAAVLGFLFAYITIRTNTVRYSIILHMMINFIGTFSAFALKDMNIIIIMLIVAWVISSVTIGAVFFIINIKRIRFDRAQQPIKTSSFIMNPGVILFLLLSIALIIYNTLAIK